MIYAVGVILGDGIFDMPVWVASIRARCQGPIRLMAAHIALWASIMLNHRVTGPYISRSMAGFVGS